MSDTTPGEVVVSDEVDTPADISPIEAAALEAEQRALDLATLKGQIDHLTSRVIELAKENARLRKELASD